MLAGWTLFTVENVIMSEYRTEIRRAWGGTGGQGAYQTFYSSLSAMAMASTVFAYSRFADTGFVVAAAAKSLPVQASAVALRAAGFAMLGQLAPPINFGAAPIALGLSTPSAELSREERGMLACPFNFNAYKDRGEVYGITRVTRRPELVGLGAVGLGGALLARTAAQLSFFGIGPCVCFSILAVHSDRTQRGTGDLSPTKEAQTSLFPFVALLDGRQSWSALREELVVSNTCAGIGLALLAMLRPSWMRFVK